MIQPVDNVAPAQCINTKHADALHSQENVILVILTQWVVNSCPPASSSYYMTAPNPGGQRSSRISSKACEASRLRFFEWLLGESAIPPLPYVELTYDWLASLDLWLIGQSTPALDVAFSGSRRRLAFGIQTRDFWMTDDAFLLCHSRVIGACWSPENFMRNSPHRSHWIKAEHIPWLAVLSVKKTLLMREVTGERPDWQKNYNNSKGNHSLQLRWGENDRRMHKTPKWMGSNSRTPHQLPLSRLRKGKFQGTHSTRITDIRSAAQRLPCSLYAASII